MRQNVKKSDLFRKLIKEKSIVKIIGAHNGFTAKLGEMAGFDAIWASGFEISSAHCLPDANILSMAEVLHTADGINKAINIPVIADCDSGFGDINNVIHMVKCFEENNIAGICMEDKLFPKLNSFIDGRQSLASISEFCEKIFAAKDTRKDENFFIIARTEALIVNAGLDEAIKRANSYVKAGADAILIHSKSNAPDEIYQFCDQFNSKIPVFIVPTTYFSVKIDALIQRNINAVIYANHGIRAIHKTLKQTYKNILENNSTSEIEDKISTMREIFDMQNMGKHTKNYEYYKNIVNNILKEQREY